MTHTSYAIPACAVRRYVKDDMQHACWDAAHTPVAIVAGIQWQDLPGHASVEGEADKQSVAATEDMDLDDAFLEDVEALLAGPGGEERLAPDTKVKELLRRKQKELTQAVSALKVRKRQKLSR